MWKKFIKDYFVFTAKERKGILILLAILISISIAPLFFPYFVKNEIIEDFQFKNELSLLKIDSSEKKNFARNSSYEYYDDYTPPENKKFDYSKAESFYFDPNTASVNDWVRLGVKEKIALNIQKYISKGGKFKTAEDLKKIWGIPKTTLDRLMPFIAIKPQEPSYSNYGKWDTSRNYTPYKPREIKPVLINEADTLTFVDLPGIGPSFARRIVKFREQLGGFYSINQVAETFMLPDSTFQKIKPYLILDNTPVKKMTPYSDVFLKKIFY
jgi:DNA uptake protein ComE-like DNA-binding protein